jgi:hypothetical protein
VLALLACATAADAERIATRPPIAITDVTIGPATSATRGASPPSCSTVGCCHAPPSTPCASELIRTATHDVAAIE